MESVGNVQPGWVRVRNKVKDKDQDKDTPRQRQDKKQRHPTTRQDALSDPECFVIECVDVCFFGIAFLGGRLVSDLPPKQPPTRAEDKAWQVCG